MEELQQDQFLLPSPPPPPPLPWEATIFSSAVQQMLEANERNYSRGPALQQTPTAAATFHFAPTASPSAAATDGVVEQYVGYIHSHFPECEPAGYVVAFVYIRRFLEKQAGRGRPFPVSSSNFHRLVLLGIMLANKNLTQRVYWNADYAAVGGMSTAEMNELERRFLSALSFDLHVDTEHYESCLAYLDCTHREMITTTLQQQRKKMVADAAESRRGQSPDIATVGVYIVLLVISLSAMSSGVRSVGAAVTTS